MIKIRQDKIGMVIGGGVKKIKEIKEKNGEEITIEDGMIIRYGKRGFVKVKNT